MKEMAQKTTFQHGRLGTLREDFKITQQDLADAISPDVKKISRELIKDIEIGSRIPKIDVVVAIAKYFKVSTDYLFGLTETPTQDTDIRMISDYTGLSADVIKLLHLRSKFRTENLEESGSLDAIDEMLGVLLTTSIECLSLTLPILHAANRKATDYIARQIIEDPKRFVPIDKEGEVVLERILNCIALYSGDLLEFSEEDRKMLKGSAKRFIPSQVIDILGRYIDIPGNHEFDRFASTQLYLKAYDSVIDNYPEDKLVEAQKLALLGNIGLRFISDDMDSGK